MNNFKKIIDAELQDIVVTEKLKNQTLDYITMPKKRVLPNLFNVKFSLVSCFIVILIMGINLFAPKTNETPISNTFNIPNLEKFRPESDSLGPSNKATTTTTTTATTEQQK